jgi:ABC-type dipeptide/oligopeptide/nickel transport system permease subunit
MQPEARTPFQLAVRRFRKNRLAMAGLLLLALLTAGSAVVPAVAKAPAGGMDLSATLLPPGGTHPFGTDAVGREVLPRSFAGLRLTFAVGLGSIVLSLAFGIAYGALSGYAGGRTDNLMMRGVDVLYGLPTLAILMLVIAVFKDYRETVFSAATGPFGRENRHLWDLFLITAVLGLTSWLTIARIVRGQVLSLKEAEFVEAARATGTGPLRILFRHIVPNLLGPVIVYATLTLPSIMLFESLLSFLGLGVQEPNVSLGLMLDDGIKRIAATNLNWWLIAFPGALLAAVLFCLNIVGDGLRDALDVR